MKTDSQLLVAAMRLLKPNSEFVIRDNDYSTIEWHKLENEPPTWEEVQSAIEIVKQQEAQAEAEAEAKREAALSKLAALGLTADDLRALGL